MLDVGEVDALAIVEHRLEYRQCSFVGGKAIVNLQATGVTHISPNSTW
jgi:hypothetical protein